MTLSPDNRRAVDAADGRAISGSYGPLAGNQPAQWIRAGNRYEPPKTYAAYERDWEKDRLKHADLTEYLAASVLLHLADGSSYLGRSVEATIRGDPYAALHMGYYAALRAGLSLLGSQGIGILDTRHVAVDSSATAIRLPDKNGTHAVVWDALSHWARTESAGELLASLIQPGGASLDVWISSASGGSGTLWRQIGEQWLLTWGADLRRYPEDKGLRNVTSYQPTGLQAAGVPPAEVAATFASELWRGLQPGGASPFERLDRFLLRRSLRKAHQALKPSEPYDAFLTRIVSDVRPFGPADEWIEFLAGRLEPADEAVIRWAEATGLESTPQRHFGVIARSCLLLRVAAGAARRSLDDGGIGSTELRAWVEAWLQDRGVILDPAGPTADLWADIEQAREEVDDWVAALTVPGDYESSLGNCSVEFWTLGSCERITAWSLAS